MLKKICFSLLFFCFSFSVKAVVIPPNADSLIKILKLKNKDLKNRKLTVYIKSVFENNPINSYSADKSVADKLMSQYNVEDKAAFDYFIDSRYQSRLLHYDEAENALIHGIEEAHKTEEHYLLYAFFSHLAFLQTFKGNTIEAVSSFRNAKKEAI